ncbi:unnamed protein product [Brassicogethes aeneus]|uniref:MORN repeat-containing protein 5 n=1 Tax=Brassicogethes aeneus TaxID=1431903 RepID=A0A9P0B384_BRAAE|nr:unnamed protein product [Brassicogethes aeneus]
MVSIENEDVEKILEIIEEHRKSLTLTSRLDFKDERRQKSSITTDWESVLKDDETNIAQVNTEDTQSNHMHAGFMEYERPLEEFCTGSKYEGSWNTLGFSGYGKYIFPHGPTYEGEFSDGLFHGSGQITYTTGDKQKILSAIFRNGDILEDTVSFQVGVKKLTATNMEYCIMPDRRFNIELSLNPLPAVTDEYLTNAETPRKLYEKTYDVGNGYFDVKRNVIIEDDPEEQQAKILIPKKEHQDWIVAHCRADKDFPVGHQPSLYEFWMAGRTMERVRSGFLVKEDSQSISYRDSTDSEDITVITSEANSTVGSTSLAYDNLAKAISEIKLLLHSVNENICPQDSVSDNVAINYMDSIIDYIQRQYVGLSDSNIMEEHEQSVQDGRSIPSTYPDEDIKEYLKKMSPGGYEETPIKPIKIRSKQVVTRETYQLHSDDDDDDDEPMSDVDFSLEDLDDDLDLLSETIEKVEEDDEAKEDEAEEDDVAGDMNEDG